MYINGTGSFIFTAINDPGPSRDLAYEHNDSFESYLLANSIFFNELRLAAGTSSIIFTDGMAIQVKSLVSEGTAGNEASIVGNNDSYRWFLLTTVGSIEVDYMEIGESRASDNRFFAGANSIDSGGNDGWIFATAPALGYDSGFFAFMR